MLPSVSTTCAKLSDDEADELASRLQLTLAAAKGTEAVMPRSVVVACDKKRAWVIWDLPPAEVLPVQPGPRFTESVIEAVEGRLQRVGARAGAAGNGSREACTSTSAGADAPWTHRLQWQPLPPLRRRGHKSRDSSPMVA